ncbi:MAG TPA: hypothetical protein PLH94_08935 [Fimbriimonadaceae bacterium]|nr:hypothetical protein [Fimbriimonadaceae bacterium]
MRICFLAGLVSVAAIGWGAEPTMVQRIVNSGLAELRQYPAVSFQLFGKETLGRREREFAADYYWNRPETDPARPARAIMNVYDGGKATDTFIGDGWRFWAHRILKKTYASIEYATELPPYPGNHATVLTQLLRSQTTGQANFLATLGFDAFGRGIGNSLFTWSPWIPVSNVEIVGDAQIVCTVGDPVRTEIIYSFTPPLPNDPLPLYKLIGVSYWDQTRVGSQVRTTEWQVTIQRRVNAYAETDFSFTPPRDAKPISFPARKSG